MEPYEPEYETSCSSFEYDTNQKIDPIRLEFALRLKCEPSEVNIRDVMRLFSELETLRNENKRLKNSCAPVANQSYLDHMYWALKSKENMK